MADYNKAIAIDPKDTASMNARRHLSSDKGDTKQELTDLNRAIEVKPDVWNYRYRANYYKKMREWDKAIADYTEAKRVDPENADYDGLAEVYEKQGDWDKALAARSEAVNHKPGDWLPYRNRAYTYKRKGDLEKADADMARVFRLLTEAVDNHPRETHYRSFRASTYSLEGQHDKAIFDYSKVIEMDPDDADAYNHRAEEYLTIREFEKALADYTRSIEIYSRNRSKSCPYGRRGNLYEELGQWEEAVADYAEEIRQSPKSEYGYVCRINAYKARGEFEKADADCAEAIEQLAENVKLNPGEWRYYAARAQIYVLKGDLDQAIDAYCEIMRVGARDGLAMSAAFQLRQLCELKGDWDRALNCLSEDIRQYPDRSSGHLARGRVYFDNGEYDEAIADFTEAIRLEPTPWGHTALAEVYEKTRNWDKAIDEASEAIRIAASQPHGAAYRLRARIYRSKGDFAKADADMRQAVQVASDNIKENPNMLHYRYLRIGLYREQQKFDQALAECNRIVDLEPKSDQPLFYRGLVYLEKGDYEKALVDFDGASSAAARHANTQAEVRIGRAMALFLSGKGDMNKAQAEYRLALRYDILAEEPFARSVGVRSQLMYQKLVDELKKP
jgi:tetratricopeptide (TPR) repeat protein